MTLLEQFNGLEADDIGRFITEAERRIFIWTLRF
jgi:hypothetical protein